MKPKIQLFFVSAVTMLSLAISSCQKNFLVIPPNASPTVDSIFNRYTNAYNAIAGAYFACLRQGLNWNSYYAPNTDDNLAGSQGFWSQSPGNIAYNAILGGGFTPNSNSEDMGSGGGFSNDGYNDNFNCIRKAYLVKENIDKVPDMTAELKTTVKAEMQALVAYRYVQMLIYYGGVPIISSSFSLSAANDLPSLAVPRAPLAAVLDTIVSWCDNSAAVLPSKWTDNSLGRMTKSAALAIKAKALMYAARPLFNSPAPYLSLGANNNLICFGSYDANRWTTALNASEAVIAEAEGAGGLGIINTGNPLADYGTATSRPSNMEIILAFKDQVNNSTGGTGLNNIYYIGGSSNYQAAACVLSTSMLENYYKADGTEQTWAGVGQKESYAQYLSKFNEMEPRLLADFRVQGGKAANNPGDPNWDMTIGYVSDLGRYGAGQPTKFYYLAGSRNWFDFPLFRLAACYLSSAEAFNESGQSQQALDRLNKIHMRAGLPAITETDQTKLRSIIHREWAIEFIQERYRFNDLKHWKDPGIGNGIIGGPIRFFDFNDGAQVMQVGNTNYQDAVRYIGYWNPKEFLNPFPQSEVNKGYLIQNPGY